MQTSTTERKNTPYPHYTCFAISTLLIAGNNNRYRWHDRVFLLLKLEKGKRKTFVVQVIWYICTSDDDIMTRINLIILNK